MGDREIWRGEGVMPVGCLPHYGAPFLLCVSNSIKFAHVSLNDPEQWTRTMLYLL